MSNDKPKAEEARNLKMGMPAPHHPTAESQIAPQDARARSEAGYPLREAAECARQSLVIQGNQNSARIAGRDINVQALRGELPVRMEKMAIADHGESRLRALPIKILFLAANPQDSARLRLDREVREIDLALRDSEFRDRFDFHQQWAVRASDLQYALLQYKPEILHFSGHGSVEDALFFEGEDGSSQPISGSLLTRLLGVFKKRLRCVVLNACYSHGQADAIAQDIECVVGMSRAIGDKAAIRFAMAFYRALGFGQDVQTAFDLGCIEVALFQPGEESTPQLITRGCPASEIVFSPA